MIKIDHNVQTGEITELEMTAEEIQELEQRIEEDKKTIKKVQSELEKNADAKTALLDKLGITEEEAKLLLS